MSTALHAGLSKEDELVTPELALVDPELAVVARARLPDTPAAWLPRRSTHTAVGVGSAVSVPRASSQAWIPDEPRKVDRERTSWRLLAGVAAATVGALLFFDVRVQVGERPAAAESPAARQQPSHGKRPSVQTPSTPPKLAPSKIPGRAKKPVAERRFAWAPSSGASAYHVEFFRGSSRVFAEDTHEPQVVVPVRWTFEGSRRSLLPGQYTWYVWPVIGGKRAPGAVVQATVSIPRA